MNINKFHADVLAALGDTSGATDVNQFRIKYVAALEGGAGAVSEKAEVAALTSNASEAHALNSTFSDTEVEAALNALGVKINAIIDALQA